MHASLLFSRLSINKRLTARVSFLYSCLLVMKIHTIQNSLVAILALATSLSTYAGQRRFSYSYEVTTAPRGAFELETSTTWKHSSDGDVFDFRHELEIGLTDHLQLGLYLADWSYERHDGAHYANSGAELIWNLSNPTTDFLGSAVYFEALFGDHQLELEGKLLLQKNLGPVTLAYNLILEAAWEGRGLSERRGEFAQTLSVSYDLNKHFSVGAEFLHEIDIPDWSEGEKSVLWFGPNASLRYGRFFATATGLFRTTGNEGEADVQTRLIVGFDF